MSHARLTTWLFVGANIVSYTKLENIGNGMHVETMLFWGSLEHMSYAMVTHCHPPPRLG